MISKFVIYIIGAFFLLGAVDYVLGNPLNLGNKFEEGIKTMGALALGIIGIYSLCPMLLKLISPISTVMWKFFRLDPSIIPSSFFAVDMGGYELCKNIAINSELGTFLGVIVGATLGATISFTLPLAFSMTGEQDKEPLAKGIMVGIVSIPVGIIAAGIWQGMDMNLLLWNMMPIVAFSILLVIGLFKAQNLTMKIFKGFGKVIIMLSILGLALQGIQLIYGYNFGGLLTPFEETMSLVGKISIILGGAYPMLEVINRALKMPMDRLGKKIEISSNSITAMIGNLASNLLVFGNLSYMNEKGKIMCTAFAVSGAFIFGGQLAYVASVEPNLLGAFFIAKVVSGILSLILSNYIYLQQKTSFYQASEALGE